MPRKINSKPPPEVMTWRRAMLVLVPCVIFDALRAFFSMFWFFGPALAALYCTSTTSGWVGSLGGLTTAACTAGAAALGFYGFAPAAIFGTVMAMAVGLIGWLAIGFLLMSKNPRIFKENAVWFGASLLVSEIPIIGSIPALTLIVWKMYRTQIRVEEDEMKKWGKEQADVRLQERKQQETQFMQMQAANDDQYTQKLEEAA